MNIIPVSYTHLDVYKRQCCGYAAPEQPGYAAYPVHVFLVLVGCWLGGLRFASLQGMAVQEYELFAHLAKQAYIHLVV